MALDLGIALEMVLLNSEHEGQDLPGQLNLHFRLRGSWLVGTTFAERKDIFKVLGRIYTWRSQVAHNGCFSKKDQKMKSDKRIQMLNEHVSVSERIFQKLVIGGIPNWNDLILGQIC